MDSSLKRTIIYNTRGMGPLQKIAKSRPRVHGNGFIQIDLDARCRLHIWNHPEIPRQKVNTAIHDHVFGFESLCLKGRLINIDYVPRPGENYSPSNRLFKMYTAECREGEDTMLQQQGYALYRAIPTKHTHIYEGDFYRIGAYDFHETVALEPSATVIVKDGPTLAQGAAAKPRILVQEDQEPDNEFNRYAASEELLWRITEEVLFR